MGWSRPGLCGGAGLPGGRAARGPAKAAGTAGCVARGAVRATAALKPAWGARGSRFVSVQRHVYLPSSEATVTVVSDSRALRLRARGLHVYPPRSVVTVVSAGVREGSAASGPRPARERRRRRRPRSTARGSDAVWATGPKPRVE